MKCAIRKKCTLNTRLCIPRYVLVNWISLQQVLQTMYVCLEKQQGKKKGLAGGDAGQVPVW